MKGKAIIVEAEKCTFFWTASARYLSAHAEIAEKCTFFGPFPHGISAYAEMAEKCTYFWTVSTLVSLLVRRWLRSALCFCMVSLRMQSALLIGHLPHTRRSSEGRF